MPLEELSLASIMEVAMCLMEEGIEFVVVCVADVDCVVVFSVKVPSSIEILGAKTQNFYHGIQYIFLYIF